MTLNGKALKLWISRIKLRFIAKKVGKEWMRQDGGLIIKYIEKGDHIQVEYWDVYGLRMIDKVESV